MKCPFCQEEVEAAETTSENVVESHCPNCNSVVAAYQKGMENILKDLISLKRFERSA